jgi:hypothetical protein
MDTGLVQTERFNAMQLYTGGGLDAVLAEIRAKATAEPADVTTAAGRKAIASAAYKVAQSKTFLDEAGKRLVEDQKRTVAKVDAERKRMRDELDALKAEVRLPLTTWEQQHEEARGAIAALRELPRNSAGQSSAALRSVLASIDNLAVGDSIPADMQAEYAAVQADVAGELHTMLAAAEKLEAEQVELARLRAEGAAREAAEAAARQARERAEAEASAAAAHAAAVERARQEGEERARREAERAIAEVAAQAEREKAAAIQAERDRQAREVFERERAAQAERDRLATEQRKREAAARTAEHRRAIEQEAAADLAAAGIADAPSVVAVIASGRVRHLSVIYF